MAYTNNLVYTYKINLLTYIVFVSFGRFGIFPKELDLQLTLNPDVEVEQEQLGGHDPCTNPVIITTRKRRTVMSTFIMSMLHH